MAINDVINYDGAFVRRAHQLLVWGYARARDRFHSGTEEEVISQYIAEQIKDMLRYDPSLPDEYTYFDVLNEPPVGDTGRTGNRRQELDIAITTTDIKVRPEFIFEAKRLKKNGYPIGDYVDREGMLCFINEEYAIKYPSSAMVGYVQSDDTNYWFTQLEGRFKDEKRTRLRIRNSLSRCQLIADLPDEWMSEHNRPTKSPIQIYHIFLDCS